MRLSATVKEAVTDADCKIAAMPAPCTGLHRRPNLTPGAGVAPRSDRWSRWIAPSCGCAERGPHHKTFAGYWLSGRALTRDRRRSVWKGSTAPTVHPLRFLKPLEPGLLRRQVRRITAMPARPGTRTRQLRTVSS